MQLLLVLLSEYHCFQEFSFSIYLGFLCLEKAGDELDPVGLLILSVLVLQVLHSSLHIVHLRHMP